MGLPPRVQSFPVIFGKSKTSSIAVLDVLRPSRAKSSPDTRPAEDTAHAPTDEKLIADVAKQDSGALAHLLDRYSRLVMRIAARILHDYGEAEEIAQEVFLYVYQKAATFDASKGTGRGWIIQLAYHRAFDRRAYLNRRSFYVGTDVASMTDTLLGDTDLDREIASRLSRVQLEKAFEELPERQRRTLELFYFEGLELREISEKLGEPLSNVRHHYYRALKKLQKSAIVQKLRDPEK